jgi:hypothetical protein
MADTSPIPDRSRTGTAACHTGPVARPLEGLIPVSKEPILELGELGELGQPGQADDPPPVRARSRHLRRDALLAVGAAAVLLAALVFDRAGPTATATAVPTATAGPTAGPAEYPSLVVQSTATAREAVTVVAHRRRARCGRTTLTFDGHRVTYRRVQIVHSPHPEWTLFVLTFDIPADAAPGAHRIALNGQDARCDSGPIEEAELTATIISIGP